MTNEQLFIPLKTNLSGLKDAPKLVGEFYDFLGFKAVQQPATPKPTSCISISVDAKTALPEGWEYRPVAGAGSKKMFFLNQQRVANIMDYRGAPEMRFDNRFLAKALMRKTPFGVIVMKERFYPEWFIDIYKQLEQVSTITDVFERFHYRDNFSGMFDLSIGQVDLTKTDPTILLAPFRATPSDYGEFREIVEKMREEILKNYRFPDILSVLGSRRYNKWIQTRA
jgi:hypothetical protein